MSTSAYPYCLTKEQYGIRPTGNAVTIILG